jgi:hypothetical protein
MKCQAMPVPTLYTMGQNRSGSRIVLIDFIRGLCLVVMTVDHLPETLIQKFTWQGFGFFSAAEGFVFLSGLVAGKVYGRIALTKGFAVLRQCALRRAAMLYLSNAVLMTLMILAAMAELVQLGRGFYPDWSLWSKFMLFIASPTNADILRMYCIFLLLLPAVIWALMTDRLYYLIAISGGLWLAAAQGYGMTALREGTGYFDLMSWQLLFVAGIYFGFAPVPNLKKLGTPFSWTTVCLAVVGMFFVARHWHFLTGQESSPYFDWLFHWKRTLPLGCLLDFAAFSALVYRFRRPLTVVATTSPGKAIAFLGQHSLQVFVWSVAATMLAGGAENRWLEPSPEYYPVVATGLILASCFLPAWLHAQWRARHHRTLDLVPAELMVSPSRRSPQFSAESPRLRA